VVGAGVFAARLETMTDSFQTNCVAVQTIVDALLHLLTHLRMLHNFFTFPFLLIFRFVLSEPRRIRVELFLARGRTKIIGSPLKFGLPARFPFVNLHSANRISLHKF
jgi:hypothetical protein